MNFLCKTVGHSWHGCRCTRCGATRDEGHDWDGCKCSVCARTRDQDHDWEGCKCRQCGMIRSEGHDWEGCICKRCNTWRDAEHDLVEGVCKKCGEIITAFECTSCRKSFTEVRRMRGTKIAVCVNCYRGARFEGQHRLISIITANQWDQEVMCVNCGQTMSYYDNGANYGVDFSKTPCR